MEVVAINGKVRTDIGKKATKVVRKEGSIPGVIYGGGTTVHFSTVLNDVRPIVYTPDFKVAEIAVQGETYRCILKDVQYHPVSEEIVHMDFLRLIDGTPVKVEVPVRFQGTSPGVKEGGKLLQSVRRIKIKTTPEHLVNEVKLDISGLNMGGAIRVRDIETNDNVEIMSAGGTPVAIVEIPRALRSAATAAAKEGGQEEAAEAEA
ncbi:MAG: 50S ribosomal protein L25 [Saprospiraceae bacterium]